ncbi:MAG: LacI family transcriptional regulator [Phycisphaerales bacterium]|nr:LacI family transcriptional regulator [Phycisphaerales bacterium]
MQDEGIVSRRGRRLHLTTQVNKTESASSLLGNTVLVVTSVDPAAKTIRQGWLGQVIEGLLGEAHQQNCNAMIVHPQRIVNESARLLAASPIGLVLLGMDRSAQTLQTFEQAGLPLILYGDEFESHGHDMITPDHVKGSYDITRWLIARGAKRILRIWTHRYAGQPRPIWLSHRDQGFEQAMNEASLPVIPALEFARRSVGPDEDSFDLYVRDLAGRMVEHMIGPEPVDAIVLPNDGSVSITASACRLYGKVPNRDVLIAGYDNDWKMGHFIDRDPTPPAVTTAHDTVHLGQALIQTLLERAGNPSVPPKRISLPPRLIVPGHN